MLGRRAVVLVLVHGLLVALIGHYCINLAQAQKCGFFGGASDLRAFAFEQPEGLTVNFGAA